MGQDRDSGAGSRDDARKKAEKVLQDSEKRYRRLFEAARGGVLIRHADTGKVVEDLPLKTRDGKSIAVAFVSNVCLVDHSKVAPCNIRDITERKRAEEALHVSNLGERL